jgi:hypothetical protein
MPTPFKMQLQITVLLAGQVDGLNVAWSAIRTGLYHRFLCKWLDVFNLTQFHFVDGENLIANPATEVAMVERFLGLPESRFPLISDIRIKASIDDYQYFNDCQLDNEKCFARR